jgi:magnesium transporter
MEKILKIGDITWFHTSNPNDKDLDEIKKNYDLHEIVEDDISETNTQDKIDIYDESMFLVLHFPKFNSKTKTYFGNEFNIILGKDFVISITSHETTHINKIREEYFEDLESWDEKFKVSTYYLLYVMVDVMYDKVLSALSKFKKDLNNIESGIFEWKKLNQGLIEQLLIKRRNGIVLKHIMFPQQEILDELNKVTLKKYGGELDVYFEDLQYKQDKIMSHIDIVNENIQTLSDTYNSLMSIKTNSMISILTIVTAIFWIMTFLTGLYGMNVDLPWQDFVYMFFLIVFLMFFVGILMLLWFKKKWWL